MDIRIGRDDELTFKNICKLVRNKFIDTNIIERVDGDDAIYEANNGNVYIFDPFITSIEVNGDSETGMGAQGASWFGCFHGKEIDTGKAAWTSLINAVAEYYHATYSFVEFKQDLGKIDEAKEAEKIERHKEIINRFLTTFKNNLKGAPVINHQKNRRAMEDIYCVSLKMEMDDGGRQTKPILCKVYFRKRDDEYAGSGLLPSILRLRSNLQASSRSFVKLQSAS